MSRGVRTVDDLGDVANNLMPVKNKQVLGYSVSVSRAIELPHVVVSATSDYWKSAGASEMLRSHGMGSHGVSPGQVFVCDCIRASAFYRLLSTGDNWYNQCIKR
jgi:hypothetical protein